MSKNHERIAAAQLDRYLDGLLSGQELADFERRLEQNEAVCKQVEIQRLVDAKLRKSFNPPTATVQQIEDSLAENTAVFPNTKRRRWLVLAVSGIAAAITWFFVAISWNADRRIEPFFEQRPLAMIYEETVEQGFRPYYFCEDQVRFALTFRKRQDVPLVLAKTPDDRRMVGLSYVGGLSRDTTAMLCYVDDKPVVVFVDRKRFDNQPLATQLHDAQLYVHRTELGDLVLYEVSPFNSPKMSPYLEIQGN